MCMCMCVCAYIYVHTGTSSEAAAGEGASDSDEALAADAQERAGEVTGGVCGDEPEGNGGGSVQEGQEEEAAIDEAADM